jgi:hypothetical protein
MIVAAFVAPLFVTGWNLQVFQVVANDPVLPKIQLWLTIIIAQAVLWVGCVGYLAATLARTNSTTRDPGRHMRAAALALVPLFVLLAYLGLKRIVFHSQIPPCNSAIPPCELGGYNVTNLPTFAGFGELVAGWAVWQMYVIRSIWQFKSSQENEDGSKFVRYLELREDVLRLLLLAGVVLSLGTLATAALRNAVNFEKRTDYFPEEYVVMYGALYSLLLLLAYLPVYTTFFASAVKIRTWLCGEPPRNIMDFKSWNETRDALSEKLGLTLTSASALGPPLSALLPVIAGWAVHLLEAKK